MIRTLILSVLLSSLLAVPCASQGVEPGAEERHERLVYNSYRPAGWDLYLYEAPGSEPIRLTDHPALDYAPTFSADGRWIVFTSERDGNPSLYVLDREADAPPRLLIRSDAMQDQPTLSPDGRWIAFVSTHGGDADIYRLPFRPEMVQEVKDAVNLTLHPGGDFRPAFSPDGERIAFSSDRDGPPSRHPRFPFALRYEADLYVMAADGSDVRRVTETPGWDGSPVWSDDGSRLIFYGEHDGDAPYRIYEVGLVGEDPRPLTPEGLPALAPALGSDGRILFSTWDQEGPVRRWRVRSAGADGDLRDESSPEIDCFEPAVHRQGGMMLCHGGPSWVGETVAAFPGPLLVSGDPRAVALPDRTLQLTGTRHAFTTPLHPTLDEIVHRERQRRFGIASGSGEGSAEVLDLDERVGFPPGQISHLRYTHDGEWISFTVGPFAGPPNAEADVWRVRSDGSDLANLTPDTPGNDGLAEFSSDGHRFVFRSGRTGNADIFLGHVDGTPPRNLTDHPANETFPAFSPHGDQVAFVSDRNGTLDEETGRRTFDVYTLDLEPDGTPGALRQITSNAAQDAHVGYSPDGAWLVYTSGKHGISDEAPLVHEVIFNPQMYGEIYAYRLADGQSVRLTHNKWEDGAPVWTSPARGAARPPVADALAEVIEHAGADSAAVRFGLLQRTSPTAYRFGEGGLYRLAHGYLREGNAGAASESFRLLQLLQPESVRPHMEFGDALMGRGDTTAAVEQYRQVIARRPNHFGAMWALSQAGAEEYAVIALSPEQRREYVGSYRHAVMGFTLELAEQDGQLFASAPIFPGPVQLTALDGNRFVLRPISSIMTVVRDDAGVVKGLEVRHSGGVEFLERVE